MRAPVLAWVQASVGDSVFGCSALLCHMLLTLATHVGVKARAAQIVCTRSSRFCLLLACSTIVLYSGCCSDSTHKHLCMALVDCWLAGCHGREIQDQ